MSGPNWTAVAAGIASTTSAVTPVDGVRVGSIVVVAGFPAPILVLDLCADMAQSGLAWGFPVSRNSLPGDYILPIGGIRQYRAHLSYPMYVSGATTDDVTVQLSPQVAAEVKAVAKSFLFGGDVPVECDVPDTDYGSWLIRQQELYRRHIVSLRR